MRAVFCGLMALIAASHAHADEAGLPLNAGLFERFDLDGSGDIDAEELDMVLSKRLASLDRDRDGQISPQERFARYSARLGQRYARADTNGDGRLSRDEMIAWAALRAELTFRRADQDGDGFVSLDEMRLVRRDEMARRRAHRRAELIVDPIASALETPTQVEDVRRRMRDTFQQLDKDADGIVTRIEATALRDGARQP